MHHRLNTLLARILVACHALTAIHAARILWQDDFTDATLSTNAWSYDVGNGAWGWGNGELQTYTEDTANVFVEDGLLHIVANRVDGTTFTSGRIHTEDKVLFQYGTIEGRIQWPDNSYGGGLWPGFWTMGYNHAQVDWPKSGEIDIMEGGQGLGVSEGEGNSRVVSGAHWWAKDAYATYATWEDAPDDLSQDFHIYRLEWTPYNLTTYVDGMQVWKMDIDTADCDCEEFHQPHFLILSLAVGGGFTSSTGSSSAGSSGSSGCTSSSHGAVSSSGSASSGGCVLRTPDDIDVPLPATLLVDYVRILDNGYTLLAGPPATESVPSPAPVTAQTAAPVAPETEPVQALETDAPETKPPTLAPVSVVVTTPAPVLTPAPFSPGFTTPAPARQEPPSDNVVVYSQPSLTPVEATSTGGTTTIIVVPTCGCSSCGCSGNSLPTTSTSTSTTTSTTTSNTDTNVHISTSHGSGSGSSKSKKGKKSKKSKKSKHGKSERESSFSSMENQDKFYSSAESNSGSSTAILMVVTLGAALLL
jgi:beta-glucanase (GH16 family)